MWSTAVNISHQQSHTDPAYKRTDTPSWPHKQTQGHERHRRSLLGLALARLSPVNQEKLAHLLAHCNTHKASRSWLFMPLNLALKIKLPSCAVIVDIVEIIYANFEVKVSLWILMVNDRQNYSSQVEEMQEDWFGEKLKTKIPPFAIRL